MVWYGMVRYGMVWYGMVWYGMVWSVCALCVLSVCFVCSSLHPCNCVTYTQNYAPTLRTNKHDRNPKNLPLDYTGKPIAYWLYKLHGLSVEYKCEICGNFSYQVGYCFVLFCFFVFCVFFFSSLVSTPLIGSACH